MRTKTLIGINGILSDGSTSTDRLLLRLAEKYSCNVKDFNYRRVNYLDVGLRLRKNTSNKFITAIAKRLVETQQEVKNPVSIIAHSFGCLVTIRALQLGLKANNIYLFAPAVHENEFINTNNVNNIFVIHNVHDVTIKIGNLMLLHEFGTMGVNGSSQKDDKITNISYTTPNPPTFMNLIKELFDNHGAYFFEHNIGRWAEFISKNCELDEK